MRRALLLAALLTVAVLSAGSDAVRADDPLPGDVYVRSRMDIGQTVRWLEREAERLEASQVLVAFDIATFAPPAGLTEFSMQYAFFRDLSRWLAALADWAKRAEISLRGTSSLAPFSVDLTEGGALERLRELVERRWWEGDQVTELEPAARWMKRLLDRTESALGASTTRGPRLLVLVSGAVTPERWIPAHRTFGWESEWRTKLRPVGEYFDEQAVGTVLQREGCRLYVVAPEAYFGDFSPMPEMPPLPWAARPQFPPEDLFRRIAGVRGGAGPAPAPAPRPGGAREEMRAQLDRALRDTIPDPTERRRTIEEMLDRMEQPSLPGAPPSTTTPGGRTRPLPAVMRPDAAALRFVASTPLWFRMVAGNLPFANHAPSGYGVWPFARAAARTKGRYLFYPFPESRWLDRCPADHALLNRLAPELVNRTRYVTLRKGDPARDALGRATALVVDDTPWADVLPFHRSEDQWTSFLRTRPLRLQPDLPLRHLPFDVPLTDDEQDVANRGERIHETTLPLYDQAMGILDEAIAAVECGEDDRSHPRSVADLRLARFWFAMSAFHLEAFSIYARELERFIPESMRGHVDYVAITYVPTIRLSDCLEGYEKRSLTLADEAVYGRWLPERAPGYQGNLLNIPADDPYYRAKRSLASVLRYLDPRLRPRAEDMIQAAKNVMRTYALTGWGWTTYYSDAYAFIFWPVEVPRGHRPTRGGGRTPDAPTTPRGPGSSGGGSSPGGPKTGG